MDATELSFGVVILLQFSIGVSVNGFLLLFYSCKFCASHKLSSSDLILAHLALGNTIIFLTGGILETVSAWGLRNFLDDVGCKILMYLYRVARGLAICTTCLLSIFQAITISPSNSWWAGVKTKLPRCLLPFCLLSWIFNMLIDIDILMNTTGPKNRSSVQIPLYLKYCSSISISAKATLMIAIVHSLWDLFFVGLMSMASGYMVFVLARHHRRVQHLHQPSSSPRAMPEVRAAKRVIALVMLYVLLYGRQTVMLSIILNMKEKSLLLVNSHMVLAFTFSAVSPFLVIHSDKRVKTLWKRKSSVSNTNPS
ncbi:vomeronasal 1 receptor ornAnaV1R3111 [Ornithorhynchus anatinus]|uniref:vomeronasal 1 receptor ornAnaV1R3111 n=1 Tax=Ornithorhynchus anatinus TaxID=9258 RepID=UPI00023ACA00|nr:vomeronasal 1 receptor ornAnaV1R3111 [Ornithorhynchus anatinus]